MVTLVFYAKIDIKTPFSPSSFQILIHISHLAPIAFYSNCLRVIDNLSHISHQGRRSITSRMRYDIIRAKGYHAGWEMVRDGWEIISHPYSIELQRITEKWEMWIRKWELLERKGLLASALWKYTHFSERWKETYRIHQAGAIDNS